MTLIGASATVALAGPSPASAHYTDQLHQHGWQWALMFNPNPMRCFGVGLNNGMGQIAVTVPDFVTTPGGNQFVAYRTQLEYYNGYGWSDRYYAGGRLQYLPSTRWNYAVANSSGLVSAVWRELGTNVFGQRGTEGYDIGPGFAFRIRVHYYWYYDGHTDSDVTQACTVSSLTGAKATKKKPSRASLGGRTRRPARVPAAPPVQAIG
jgi:hypothetical protein